MTCSMITRSWALHGVGYRHVVVVGDLGPFEQLDQGLRLVGLSGREVEVERVAVAVAEEMDLRRETASREAQRMVRGLVGVAFFPPPEAQCAARTTVPSTHHSWSSIAPTSTCAAKPIENLVQQTAGVPLVEVVPNRLRRRQLLRHITPRRVCPQDPQDGINHHARIAGGRPVRAGFGNRSSITSQWSSVSRCRSMGSPSVARCRQRSSHMREIDPATKEQFSDKA